MSPQLQPAAPATATKAEPTDFAEIRKMFENLSLLLKQSRTNQGQRQRFTRPCGHCSEIDHIMSRCPKNPYRNKYCGYCGKLGHIVSNCYSRARNPASGFRPVQGSQPDQTPAPQTPQEHTAALVIAPQTPEPPQVQYDHPGSAMLAVPVAHATSIPAVNAMKRAHDSEQIRKQLRPRPEGRVEDIRRLVNIVRMPPPIAPRTQLSTNPTQTPEVQHPTILEPPARQPAAPTQRLGYQPPASLPPVKDLLPSVIPADKTKKKQKSRRNASGKKKHTRRTHAVKEVQARAPPYDVVTALANTPSGLTFGQLARGDADTAKPKICSLLSSPRPRPLLATGPYEEPPALPRKHRKITGVLRGVEVPIVLDTGAIPNLMSEEMMQKLGLQLTRVGGRLKLAKNLIVECAGAIEDLPVTLGVLTISMTFTIFADATYPILVGNPTLESLYYRICSRTQCLSLIYHGEEVHLPIEYYEDKEDAADATDNQTEVTTDEEFSSTEEDETDWEAEGSNLVLATTDVDEEDMDALLEEKLTHFEPEDRDALRACTLKHDIIARDLSDLRPADVPCTHTFKLTEYTPITAPVRRLDPDHDEEVRKQVD